MSRLTGVELKIERAKQHIADFQRSVNGVVDSKPYQTAVDRDPNSGDKVFRLRITTDTPRDWPAVIGDIANNLRSALDHLAWQLVEVSGGIPGRHTSFPICEDRAKYEATANGAKIHGARTDIIRILDAIQPYKGGNDALFHLNAVAVHDKHRFLIGAPFVLSGMTIQKEQGVSRFHTGLVGQRVPAVDGMELGRLIFPFNDADQVYLKCSFLVSFVEPQVVKGETVVPLLSQFAGAVDEVVDKFRPLLV